MRVCVERDALQEFAFGLSQCKAMHDGADTDHAIRCTLLRCILREGSAVVDLKAC